jgi:hypothetical protein
MKTEEDEAIDSMRQAYEHASRRTSWHARCLNWRKRTEGTGMRERIMEKNARVFVAFTLNLFPGLGFFYSAGAHKIRWLRLFGSMLVMAFLFIIPASVVIVHPYPLMNYHLTLSDLALPMVIALVSGVLGAAVEYRLSRYNEICNK